MKTKEEVIKEAYGIQWDNVKDYADENGWIDFGIYGYNEFTKTSIATVAVIHKLCGGFENMETKQLSSYPFTSYHRPKSLQGIDDNFGWISINSEKDLPKTIGDNDVYLFDFKNEINIGSTKLLKNKDIRSYWLATVTHYQPIVKPNLPLHK